MQRYDDDNVIEKIREHSAEWEWYIREYCGSLEILVLQGVEAESTDIHHGTERYLLCRNPRNVYYLRDASWPGYRLEVLKNGVDLTAVQGTSLVAGEVTYQVSLAGRTIEDSLFLCCSGLSLYWGGQS